MRKKVSGHNRSEAVAVKEPYCIFLDAMRQRWQGSGTVKSAVFSFGHLDAFLKGEGKAFCDITEEDLNRFRRLLTAKGLAVMSVDLILRHVRHLFRWLARTGRIFLDPAAEWVLPIPDRPLLDAPSEEQMAALLRQPDISTPLGVRDRAFIEVAYSTGARRAELTGLTIHDLNLDAGLLRLMGKGRKERMVPLGRQAVQWLHTYLSDIRPRLARGRLDEDWLWLGQEGKPIQAAGLRMMLRVHSIRAGLKPVSVHALRRACVTHMLRNGAHPVQIQTLLGHADLTSLSQYLRLTIRDIRKMHAASKVGR
jgi:integrase/recombinase XerD